jgi:hypothetical protein
VADFHFREVRKQLIVARFGRLNRAISTTPHQAEANGLRFRFFCISVAMLAVMSSCAGWINGLDIKK